MAIRVGINGFGRIGRNFFRACLDTPDVELVAINDLTDANTLAHLLQYDSVLGILPHRVTPSGTKLQVANREVHIFSERDPATLPWADLGVEYVVESTGLFTKREDAEKHLKAGARKVIISAPATNPDITLVMGVNEDQYRPADHAIISNASCTTNCLAPVAKVLLDRFGIVRGQMTTIHSYTNDQRLLDLPHKDLRRARAAALSMIPTTTGAAKALYLVLPELEGKMDGMAIRVPTPNVSVVDLVVELEQEASEAQIRAAYQEAAQGRLAGILEYTEAPLVSVDFKGNPHSAIVDGSLIRVLQGRMAKVIAWYDNEWAYAVRLRDLIRYLAQRDQKRS